MLLSWSIKIKNCIIRTFSDYNKIKTGHFHPELWNPQCGFYAKLKIGTDSDHFGTLKPRMLTLFCILYSINMEPIGNYNILVYLRYKVGFHGNRRQLSYPINAKTKYKLSTQQRFTEYSNSFSFFGTTLWTIFEP